MNFRRIDDDRLAISLDETTTLTTEISDISIPSGKRQPVSSRPLDAGMKKNIEAAAIHHFGPIGAMVCEEHLHAGADDARSVMLAIAQEVGASETDTLAFFKSVSEN